MHFLQQKKVRESGRIRKNILVFFPTQPGARSYTFYIEPYGRRFLAWALMGVGFFWTIEKENFCCIALTGESK
jgi:hypothetical protein